MLDINQIESFLPHRFPFLLVDRIIEIEKGKRVVGIKNITGNDYYHQEIYSDTDYLFPAALQVEAMAQVAGFVVMDLLDNQPNQIFLLAAIESARFRKPLRAGDQLRMVVELKKFKAGTGKFYARSFIGEQVVSEVKFTAMLAPVSIV